MPAVSGSFENVNWRRIKDTRYRTILIDYEYCVLGYDLKAKRVDIMMRFGERGQNRPHRHLASTSTLVLEGEQHTVETLRDGSFKATVHPKGTYLLPSVEVNPHFDHGGPQGATVLMSMVCPDGKLFEFFDDDLQNARTLTLQECVSEWLKQTIFGPTELPADGIESYRLRYMPTETQAEEGSVVKRALGI